MAKSSQKSNSRKTGLLTLLLASAVFLGTNMELLPAELFWVGIVLYPIGGVMFLIGNRAAMEQSDARHAAALNPKVRNQRMEAYAEQQAQGPRKPSPGGQQAVARKAALDLPRHAEADDTVPLVAERPEEVELEDSDDSIEISTDVSFPVEIQERNALAEQLDKLHKLHEDGILSEQELAAAKAKLLG
ncbi:MAG: SHOCT domain-containing protein [Proteobacteria bacterium]|nr:SHOCT domain-containing protein [Pseudomonadota bacterium]